MEFTKDEAENVYPSLCCITVTRVRIQYIFLGLEVEFYF